MDAYDKNVFARNLIAQMNEHHETQSQLAAFLKVSRTTVSEWCRGSKLPRMGKIEQLAQHWGIKKSDLIEDKPKGALSRLTPMWNEFLKKDEKAFCDYLRMNLYEIVKTDTDYIVKWHTGTNDDGTEEIEEVHITAEEYKQIRRTVDDYVNYTLQKLFRHT